MNDAYFLCVNPASGGGKAVREWVKIKEKLHQEGLKFDYAISTFHRETIAQTEVAIQLGYKKIVAIGGDGTLHHIVNGIFNQNKVESTEIETSIISIGTGNDWLRYYGFPKNYNEAIQIIKNEKKALQDVGVLSFNNGLKKEYFINFSGIGFDSYVVEHTSDLKKYGNSAYYFGIAKSLLKYNNIPLKIYVDDKLVVNGNTFMVIAGLGKYIGGGMKVCKNAIIDDGYFDLTIGGDFNKMEVIPLIPKLFSGNFEKSKKVRTLRGKNIKIITKGHPDYKIETDGDIIGTGDFEISIKPLALKTIVP